jgi:hypothetical protein
MRSSLTRPGCQSTRVDALRMLPSAITTGVGTRDNPNAGQWLAYALPYRRFTAHLAARMHGSGPMWVATPSPCRTSTDYSLPASRRPVIDFIGGHTRTRTLGPLIEIFP